jgi:hypothetical protein
MDRTTAANYVTVSGKRQFIDVNPATSTPGTEMTAEDWNQWMEELLGPIEGTGIVPSSSNVKQLWQALKRIAGGNVGAVVTASETLTADNAGLVVVNATSGNIVLTLPLSDSAGGVPFNFHIARIDSAPANTVTLAFAGTDAMLVSGMPATLAPGQVLHAGASGGTTWLSWLETQTGSADLVTTAGWEKRPTGLIEQWAQGLSTTGNGDTVSFPIAFPTACAGVVLSERNASGGWVGTTGATLYGASGATASGFTLFARGISATGANGPQGGISYFYRALGW